VIKSLKNQTGGAIVMPVTKEDIKKAISENGLSKEVICIHSSLKSYGEVDGGADTVINAFLEEGCTILAPSFSYDYQIPREEEIEQNGRNNKYIIEPHSRIYTSETKEIAPDMGAIPRAMENTAGRFRGIHPTNSFVALGPEAEELISCQTFKDVYAPFQKMMDKRGKIIMMGVDLTKMTAIHYAEQLSGRNLFIRWVLDENGNSTRMCEGSCSEGFNNLASATEKLEKQVVVGNSLWRIFPIFETVNVCAEAIKQNSGITHCTEADCILCNDMQNGGPILVHH